MYNKYCEFVYIHDNEVLRFQRISTKYLNVKNQIKSVFATFETHTV